MLLIVLGSVWVSSSAGNYYFNKKLKFRNESFLKKKRKRKQKSETLHNRTQRGCGKFRFVNNFQPIGGGKQQPEKSVYKTRTAPRTTM